MREKVKNVKLAVEKATKAIDEAVGEIKKLVMQYPQDLAQNKITPGVEFISEVGEICSFEDCLQVAKFELGARRIQAYRAEREFKEATEGEKEPPFQGGEELGKRAAKSNKISDMNKVLVH